MHHYVITIKYKTKNTNKTKYNVCLIMDLDGLKINNLVGLKINYLDGL